MARLSLFVLLDEILFCLPYIRRRLLNMVYLLSCELLALATPVLACVLTMHKVPDLLIRSLR